ncbi:MAG: efflux transporter outer membrane subunit [Aliidongia sp.]
MNTMRIFLAPLLAAAILAGCTDPVGPQESGIDSPSRWSRLGGTEEDEASRAAPLASNDAVQVEQRWWKSFGDPALDQLIDGALANNKTLQIAAARVEEARANRRGTIANLMPDITATGSSTRGNQGYATLDKTVNINELDLQASWEVDLFGKNQARAAQASAILQSSDASRQAVMVSLLAEVARSYFDLRNSEEQIEITQKNLLTQQRTLDLIKAQQAGALTSNLDIDRGAAQVATTSSQIPALRGAYEVALDHLNILMGQPPGTKQPWLMPSGPLQPLAPEVLVAAPAKVLAARPDIRAAERNFAASIEGADAAAKEIYPTISLTALFGVQQSSPFNATPWGVGAGLVQPLLDFGRIQSQIDAADAQQKQAFLNYQETVLEALEDMENALSLYYHETDRRRDLARRPSAIARPSSLPTGNTRRAISGCSICSWPSAMNSTRNRAWLHPTPSCARTWCISTRRPVAAGISSVVVLTRVAPLFFVMAGLVPLVSG